MPAAELTLTTPALLFPTISLLMVAYTNRFLALGNRIRNLAESYRHHPEAAVAGQLTSLRRRIVLIRNMQAFGVSSLFSCVLCMFFLFAGKVWLGKVIFGLSLVLMLVSLALSFREILLSINALELELGRIDEKSGAGPEQS